MRLSASLFALVVASMACAHRVPLYCDESTPCTDDERPFCDLAGEFPASEGIGNTCIPTPESDTDAGPDAGDDIQPNFVFATSSNQNATLGGLAGADAICNDLAVEAGRPGRYVAWLSTQTVNARDRLAGAAGWVRTDGLPFANTVEDMLAGRIFYPADRDENGNPVGGHVFTGTKPDGTYDPVDGDCNAWLTVSDSVLVGRTQGGFQMFTAAQRSGCGGSFSLLCFGVDRNARVDPPEAAGRLAFVTRGRHDGLGGIGAFDALCAQEASAAGRSGTFLAAVATDTVPPSKRMNLDGLTWVRTDGVKVFENAQAIDGDRDSQMAPIQYAIAGDDPIDDSVWSGASGFSGINPTCGNWASAVDGGVVGRSALAGIDGTGFNGAECASPFPVYCFEQ